jgi:dTDP-4-amino-4,6-dideoxygalactose transaminase
MFYLVCKNVEQRTHLINHLKENDILAVFHYLSLHKSQYYSNQDSQSILPNSDFFTDCLVRLPLFYELTQEQLDFIIEKIISLDFK